MGKHQMFRANVGAVVVNDAGLVLALRRSGHRHAWQLPQGGLGVGEEPAEAALRELREETGLRAADVELVDEHPEWIAYELPERVRSKKTRRGQVQKWFLFRLRAGQAAVDLGRAESAEFDKARWMPLSELAQRTWEVRRPAYARIAAYFGRDGLA